MVLMLAQAKVHPLVAVKVPNVPSQWLTSLVAA